MIIRFSSDADAELAEARQWYAHQREDLDLLSLPTVVLLNDLGAALESQNRKPDPGFVFRCKSSLPNGSPGEFS